MVLFSCPLHRNAENVDHFSKHDRRTKLYFPNDNKKAGYTIKFIANDGSVWKAGTSANSEFYEESTFIGADDEILYSLMIRKPKEDSKAPKE